MDERFEDTAAWLRAAKAGDREVLGALLQRFRDPLLGRIRMLMGPQARAVAESGDFLQEVFLEAVSDIRGFELRSNGGLVQWLTQIARNRIRASLRCQREQAIEAAATRSIVARSGIGPEVTTRGGVNCELFYAEDAEAIKAHVHRVLDGCAGYRHMIGDTNNSVPPYKWEMIRAVIDAVRERGARFE